MTFTRKAYETIINLFLKDPLNCHRGKEYRLAKFMLNMIPDLSFWQTVNSKKVSSLTYFLTKENKSLLKEEYGRYIKLSNFDLSTFKNKEYNLYDKKVGEDSETKVSKKTNRLDFIKHGSKKEN